MIQAVLSIAFWITGTIGYYLVVGYLCRGIRNNPLGVRVYLATRSKLTEAHRYGWYAAIIFATIVAGSGITWLGTKITERVQEPLLLSALAASASLHYALLRLWPRGPRPHHKPILPRWRTMAAYSLPLGYVALLRISPEWWAMNLGTFMLVTPVLIWLCGIRMRTAFCLLAGLAIHDGIHVFGTGWMDQVMNRFVDTPFVLQVPKAMTWHADFFVRVGHGDILVPGILVVSAARLADSRHVRSLLLGTTIGAGLGFALATAITIAIQRSLPFLIVVVPTTLLGYALGQLSLRRQRTTAKLAPQSQPL